MFSVKRSLNDIFLLNNTMLILFTKTVDHNFKALFFLILGLRNFFQNIKVGGGKKITIKITKKTFFYLI